MSICVYTAVCEADMRWIPQYLTEIERLGFKFAVHFDKCERKTKLSMQNHRLCIGTTALDARGEFTERDKQGVLDIVQNNHFDWAMPMDIDETWERGALAKLQVLQTSNLDYIMLPWVNLWGDARHVRTDGPFKTLREKMYNMRSGVWRFLSTIVNGAILMTNNGRGKLVRKDDSTVWQGDCTCLHWGLMTKELRVEHKARWDRIYEKATKGGGNPYGIWDYALDETKEPRLEENVYL